MFYARKINNMSYTYSFKRLNERYREKKREPHMVFINLERTYDVILKYIIWHVLEKRHVHKRYIDAIKDM